MNTEMADTNTGEVVDLGNLGLTRDPKAVLAEAKSAAVALTEVLKNKKKPVMMNGEQYLEFEDWQTLGRFYGVTVKVASTTYVEFGGVKGFEARAEVLDRTGLAISAAEAMCLNDEDKWSTRAKYEWKTISGQRVKEKVGEEQVPMFQLRSMAQTRACAKAFRNVLAWVVVLAGYKPTPAEEMTGAEHGGAAGNNEDSPYRTMTSKFAGKCAICSEAIAAGMSIVYNSVAKAAAHPACFEKKNAQPRDEQSQA